VATEKIKLRKMPFKCIIMKEACVVSMFYFDSKTAISIVPL